MRRLVPVLVASAVSACSLAFPLGGYATDPAGDGGASTDGGGTMSDGGGGQVLTWALLVAADSTETFLAAFDETGELASVSAHAPLNGPGSGVALVNGVVIAVNDNGVARAQVQPDGRPGAWTTINGSPRRNATGALATTPAGAINGPGAIGNTLATATFTPAGGLGTWNTSAERLDQPRERPALVATSAFVLVIGGRQFFNGNDVPSASIEVSVLGQGLTPGRFNGTTPLPRRLDDAALGFSEQELFVCGGRGDTGVSDQCFAAAVGPTGSVQPFRRLADLPNGTSGGALLKIGRKLHLFGASSPQLTDHAAQIFTLDLDAAPGAWRRSTLRLPMASDVAQGLRLTP